MIEEPLIRVPQVYVKRIGGRPWYTTFVRHIDGSCGFWVLPEGTPQPPGSMILGLGALLRAKFRRRPNAWREALRSLAEQGFVPLAEARRRGWVPASWQVAKRPRCGWVRPRSFF